MKYHIRISQKSSKSRDEVKLDLEEEELLQRYIKPYNNGDPIIINGKTILIDDLERIRVSKSKEPSSAIIGRLEAEDRRSPVLFIRGPSLDWRAADGAEDATDEFIKGPAGSQPKATAAKNKMTTQESKTKVFIVHGHDNALKSDLEVFCREIGLDPVVLHRKADEGLTVIEKFEQHSDVKYAFILLTPDDLAYPISEAQKEEKDRKTEYRARQNVIFEFGFFAAKLGRARVCCVYKEGVTLPSDLGGLISLASS